MFLLRGREGRFVLLSVSLSLFLLLTSIGVNEIWRGSIVEEGIKRVDMQTVKDEERKMQRERGLFNVGFITQRRRI